MSALSREEVEKIVSDFDKIANRAEKKAAVSNLKMMIIIVSVVMVVILIIGYFYWHKTKKGTVTPKAAGQSPAGSAANSSVQVQTAGQPINVML